MNSEHYGTVAWDIVLEHCLKLAAIFKETQSTCKANRGTDYARGWSDAMCRIRHIILNGDKWNFAKESEQ
jgi:hypothetical protein